MRPFFDTATRAAALVLTSSLLVAGCSSSSDSPTLSEDVNAVSQIDSIATTAQPEADPISNEVSDEVIVNANDPTEETSEPVTPASNSTQVDFGITVPAFQSDALQVRLIWGDTDVMAGWVGDELWTTSLELPTDTENTLSVTFSDSNGDITLASFEEAYRTGSNAAEMFNIAAEQFNSEQWDADNDGISNLDELIAGSNPNGDEALEVVQASLELVPDKTFRLSWQPSATADFYRVLENADGLSGFEQISEDLTASTQVYDHRVALYNRVNARYIVQACNAISCVDSDVLVIEGTLDRAIGYIKASNTDSDDLFGADLALSADSNTLAIGAIRENSAATGVNGDQDDNSALNVGAVYVYIRVNGAWQQQAYLKASTINPDSNDLFGASLALSEDGNTLAVSAIGERSAATGVNGDQSDNSLEGAGAVYVFERTGNQWQQQAYLKSAESGRNYRFGASVSLSADGDTLAVGESRISVFGDVFLNGGGFGAVQVFRRNNLEWQPSAYFQSEVTIAMPTRDEFGDSVSLSADGTTLAVGAPLVATPFDVSIAPEGFVKTGAVYMYKFINGTWEQQANVKPNNVLPSSVRFGNSVSLSGDGNTLAVGSEGDGTSATGISLENSGSNTPMAASSGAVFVFDFINDEWSQQAYIKASNTDAGDLFGHEINLSRNGNTLAIASITEESQSSGINGDETDNSTHDAGAAFVFRRNLGSWRQQAYLKATNTARSNFFGSTIKLSRDGSSLAVGAVREGSSTTGVNSNPDNLAVSAGAVYLY